MSGAAPQRETVAPGGLKRVAYVILKRPEFHSSLTRIKRRAAYG
jgi:hypothetical protein